MYGIVTLKINEHEFPVHRDILANYYSFFKDMPGEFTGVTLDPAIVTPDALDYLLCFHYPDVSVIDDPSFALCSEVLVAWDFFGGGLEVKESESTRSYVIGGASNTTIIWRVREKMKAILNHADIRDLALNHISQDTVVDAMKRHPDIFNQILQRYEELTTASPEKLRMLVERKKLKSMHSRVPLEGLTKRELCREYGKTFKGCKEELLKLIADNRAQTAFEILMKTCDATESARRELFDEMVRVHEAYEETSEPYCYYMLSNGQILRTKLAHRSFFPTDKAVIDGPEDVTSHFFYDIGPLPMTIMEDVPVQCIRGSPEALGAVRDRFIEVYAL